MQGRVTDNVTKINDPQKGGGRKGGRVFDRIRKQINESTTNRALIFK